ncbi:hypothetical protein [Halocatena marina]|uniref:hypothetical protein n=1 Tax=Halocatena marina TaxID=2934937 RepID=UPI002010C655|nr:hypothetical protein [Halocatena marina]
MAILDSVLHFLRGHPLLSGVTVMAVLVFVVVFVRYVLLYGYKRSREETTSADGPDWQRKIVIVAKEVQWVWESKYVEPESRGEAYSIDEVKGEMGLLADKLDRNASNVTANEVPPEFVTMIYETAQKCRSVESCLTGVGQNPQFVEEGTKAVEAAEKLEKAARHHLQS